MSACGTESPPDFGSTGGATARGGQPGAGGASGGAVANGGAPSFGGVAGSSNGGTTNANGGTVSAGGAPAAGGASSGKGGSAGSGAGGAASGGAASGGGGGGGASGGNASGGKASGGAGGAAGSTGTGGGAGMGDGKSAGCGKTRTLTNGRKTIQSGGNREYILRVPDDYSNTKPYRLIFAFHWRDGNANQVANGGMGGSTEDPFYGLWDLAKGSTIFIAPEGLNAGWANSPNERDVVFTDAILDAVQKDLCIDTTRIFSTGFSFGAGMSYALACARPNVFRGVALYAGAQLSGCNGGTKPVAYFHAHGIRDSVLNISQGRPLRDRFVMNNGCTSQSPPEPSRNSGTHTCTSYAGCTAGYPVRWCAFDGDHNPTEKDAGQSESWVPGEAWQFISQF